MASRALGCEPKEAARETKIRSGKTDTTIAYDTECRFSGKHVYVRKQGADVVLSPTFFSWDAFFQLPSAFGNNYLATRDNTSP